MKITAFFALLVLGSPLNLYAADFITTRTVRQTVGMQVNGDIHRPLKRTCMGVMTPSCEMNVATPVPHQPADLSDPLELVFCSTNNANTLRTYIAPCNGRAKPFLSDFIADQSPFERKVPCSREDGLLYPYSCSSDLSPRRDLFISSSDFPGAADSDVGFKPLVISFFCETGGDNHFPFSTCPRANQKINQVTVLSRLGGTFSLPGSDDANHRLAFSWANHSDSCPSTACSFTNPVVSWMGSLALPVPDQSEEVFTIQAACLSSGCAFSSDTVSFRATTPLSDAPSVFPPGP
jgi:hypothetical protein